MTRSYSFDSNSRKINLESLLEIQEIPDVSIRNPRNAHYFNGLPRNVDLQMPSGILLHLRRSLVSHAGDDRPCPRKRLMRCTTNPTNKFSEPQMGGFGKCPQIGAVHNKKPPESVYKTQP